MLIKEIDNLEHNSITLERLYKHGYPDKYDLFWCYVNDSDFTKPLRIQQLSSFNLKSILTSQYRVETIEELMELLKPEQHEIVQSYVNKPLLSKQIIVIHDGKIVDGNHRALSAAIKNVPINYVDLSDLDKQGLKDDLYNNGNNTVDEMALSTYKTMGDFNKPGPFTGVDKKLVPHPKNIEKATTFFEKTPYDFRLFFSNITGTGRYSEYGPMNPDLIKEIFGDQANQILTGIENTITVVFVGNTGDRKVMLTPWMMAHRFGHAINAGGRKNGGWSAWYETEKHFFNTINNILEQYYGKTLVNARTYNNVVMLNWTPEYNALFNAIGTQRSSRTGEIKRPYEFMYEIFAQYLGTGNIVFNPLPARVGYGKQSWGKSTKHLIIRPEYSDEQERKNISEMLARDMELMFDDVLSSSIGKVFVM